MASRRLAPEAKAIRSVLFRKQVDIAGLLQSEFAALRGRVTLAELEHALLRGEAAVNGVLEVETVAGVIRANLQPMLEKLLFKAASAGAPVFAESFGIPELSLASFSDWADRASTAMVGELVTDITSSQRAAITEAIHASFSQSLTSAEAADMIRDSIGLTSSGVRGFDKFVDNLLATSEDSAASIQAQIDAEYERRVQVRAEMIAQTEIVSAATEAQHEIWREAVHEGELDPNRYRRQWFRVLGAEPCDECDALDGQEAEIDGAYPDGSDGPPAHPRCVCSEQLVRVYAE